MFSCSDVPIGKLIAFSSPIPLIFVFHCYLKFWNENWIDSHTERWRRKEKSSQMFFIYKDFTKFPSAHQLIAGNLVQNIKTHVVVLFSAVN